MTIYDVLCYSKENCHLADEWVNVGSLASVQGGTLAKGNDFFQNAGQYFDGKTNKLACACVSLGGRKIKKGDVGYELELFLFFPCPCVSGNLMRLPASLQILTDKNILDYMHYETLMFAITHILNRLKEECEEG